MAEAAALATISFLTAAAIAGKAAVLFGPIGKRSRERAKKKERLARAKRKQREESKNLKELLEIEGTFDDPLYELYAALEPKLKRHKPRRPNNK